MSDSIYAPPEADLSVPDTDQPRYYVVAPRKFLLLSLLTVTFYFYYWFYRNWRSIKVDDNDDLWAPARGIFYIFFTHSLFTDIQENLKNSSRSYSWQPGLLATLFVILIIGSNVFDRLVPYESFPVLSGLTPLIATVLTTLLLLPAQKAINIACDDEKGDANSQLSAGNWVWMVLGGFVWFLLVVGTYAVVTDPTLQ